MIPRHRTAFNAAFTDAHYTRFQAALEQNSGGPVEFHLSETPCFLPAALSRTLVEAADNMVTGLLGNAAYRRAADAMVHPGFRLTHGEDLPTFIQVDLGFVQGPSGLEGRLVELQAFPSLYGFQLRLAETAIEEYGLPGVSPFFGDLTRADYLASLRRAIVGRHDPAEVVLLENQPRKQKTWPDFVSTEAFWGVEAIDLAEVIQRGRRLFRMRHGVETPIARIYNRVIPDELEKHGRAWPFSTGEADVEWAGGPDWFFRLSKFAIPWIEHPWVPETHYLSDLDALPTDREAWLLKPLFSFAGGGIVFAPTDEEIAAIPEASRREYILQRRIAFTPVIETPHGPTFLELRVMMVREGDGYRALMPLGRMGRGKMMGVDYNKGLKWVGAAAVLIETQPRG
jgi:hypothetical protein